MATYQEPTSEPRAPTSDYEVRTPHDGGTSDRSVGSLLGELAGESSALLKAEITLARKEMQDNLTTMQRGAMSMGAGAGILMAGVLALVAAAILGIAHALPDWLSALIVGAALTIAGAIMLAIGKRKASAESIKPGRTLSSLGDMKVMAQHERDRAQRKWQ
jgi:hypothetical protein